MSDTTRSDIARLEVRMKRLVRSFIELQETNEVQARLIKRLKVKMDTQEQRLVVLEAGRQV